MKKNVIKIGSLLIATLAFGFSLNAQTQDVIPNESKVMWKGYKVTGYHEGTVKIVEGTMKFDQGKLVGGQVQIDMSSINATDLEGEYKGKLEGHLKSDDFFGTTSFPTALLVIKEATPYGKNGYKVKGNITIKGVTKPVDLTMQVYANKVTASMTIDRTEFGLRYGSTSFFDSLGDKAIYDDFDIVADLTLKQKM